MKLSTEQVRGITELREKLQERLEQLHREVEMTMLNIDALDAALTQSSFTRASQYTPDTPTPDTPAPNDTVSQPEPAQAPVDVEPTPEPAPSPKDDAVPIMVNDSAIGGISTTDDEITITLYVPVSIETPPFRAFFLSRIIGGMVEKDKLEAENGKLPKDSVMRYELKTQGDTLDQIIIYNYRLEARAREIASTIRWALSRMLEHAK